MENKVITVHSANLNLFNERLEEINKKFAKKNYPLIKAECIKEPEMIKVEVTLPNSIEVREISDNTYQFNLTSEFNEKNVAGVDVKFEGIVDFVDGDENSKVFKVDNPEIFKFLDKCECDECHKAIGRNKYIIFSKASEIKSRSDLYVLGTTCARNYFPFDVESYLGFLADVEEGVMGEFDEYCGFSSHSGNYVPMSELYNVVGFVTQDFNVYKKSDDEYPTRIDVANILFDNKAKGIRYTAPKVEWADMEEWLKGAYGEVKDEFTSNIHAVMFEQQTESNPELKLREDVNYKYLGLACYAFVGAKRWHDRELEKEAKAKMYKDSVADEWFGEVGAKFEKELMFEKIIGFENDYGYTYFLFFRDEEGHVYKWSSSKGTYQTWCKNNGREGYCEYEIGKKYLLKGSIKAHDEYKGIKQTVITRCKVLKDECENHIFSKKEAAEIREELHKAAEKVSCEDPFDVFDIA